MEVIVLSCQHLNNVILSMATEYSNQKGKKKERQSCWIERDLFKEFNSFRRDFLYTI